MIKTANQIMVFILELAMLGSFAYFGFQIGNGKLLKFGLAIIIPVLAMTVWGYWAAPRSRHRLTMPYLAIFRLSLFLLASLALYKCGQIEPAVILAVASTVTQVISLFTERSS